MDEIDLRNVCRICLGENQEMVSLSERLEGFECLTPSFLEVLEDIMQVELILDDHHPQLICITCKQLLKDSHHLKTLFNNSQIILAQYTNEDTVRTRNTKDDKQNLNESFTSVDLIVGDNKFNLNDVLILEENQEEDKSLEPLLSNLDSVSIECVNKQNNKELKVSNTVITTTSSTAFGNTIEIIAESDDTIKDDDDDAIESDDAKSVDINKNDVSSENDDSCINTDDDDKETAISEPKSEDENINPHDAYDITIVTKDDIDFNRFQCKICNAKILSKSKLQKHVFLKHFDLLREDFCQDCAYSFAITKDGTTSPPSNEKDSESLQLQCSKCGVFYERRIKGVLSQSISCQECGHTSKSVSAAKYHAKRHLGISYECKLCGKKYTHNSTLKIHMEVHKNNRNKLCTVCGKSFVWLSSLVYHMRMHTNERRFSCPYCPKLFNYNASYRRHLITHTKVRSHFCSICSKGFYSRGEKRNHEYTHYDVKPYQCKHCSKSFPTSYILKVHCRKHKGSYACDLCNKTFINMEYLKLHQREKHPIDEVQEELLL